MQKLPNIRATVGCPADSPGDNIIPFAGKRESGRDVFLARMRSAATSVPPLLGDERT
jgi:hypothetical protein